MAPPCEGVMTLTFSVDPESSALIIDGRPPPARRAPPAQMMTTQRAQSTAPQHGDPFPQALDGKPDLLVIAYPQVPSDSKAAVVEGPVDGAQLGHLGDRSR